MKKILLSLFILFMPVCLWSGGVLFMGGGVEVSGVCTGIVGQTTVGASANNTTIIIGGRYQNTLGCDLTALTYVSLYIDTATVATKAKVAIYDDNSAQPGNLLWSSAEFDPSALGTAYHDIDASGFSSTIANNAYSWICFWTSGNIRTSRETAGGEHTFYNYDYDTNSGVWPATGASFGTGTNVIYINMEKE